MAQKIELKGKSFLTLKDFTKEEIKYFLSLASYLKTKKKIGIKGDLLEGKNIALLFEKASTRTRCSFEVAAHDEGAQVTYLGPKDCHMGKKESMEDTAKVLGRFFDGIEFRGYKQETVECLSNKIVNSEFTRITYTKAIELLLESGQKFEYPVEWGCDLQTEHERYITEQIFNAPVFVTDYPKEIKAFYMRMNEDGKTVRAMDLLVPGVGEIIGGSQREERYDLLMDRIKECGLNEEDYWWYLELRKYGTATHSGFGLGFERIIMYLTGISNIRDVIPFPRTPKNAEF